MRLFKQVELKDGELVQFVGVYVTRWQPEWGQPSVGFVEVDENEQAHTADRLTPAPDRNDRQKGKIMDARVSGKIISYGKQRYRTNMKGIWHVLMFGSHGPTDPSLLD